MALCVFVVFVSSWLTVGEMSFRSSRSTVVVLVTVATFADLLAYSICVPVLPDFARRLGASASMIGLMFANADSLATLFAARMVQGAADGVTWVVGFALIADRYRPEERGRVMGYVMSGTSLGIMVGPSIGGWLYEAGGVALPFQFVSVLALVCAVGFALVRPQPLADRGEVPSIWAVMRVTPVALCAAAVVLTGATVAMLEPVLPLFFDRDLGLTPARIGLLFGMAAVGSTLMPLVYGPMIGRWGARRLTLAGLILTAAWLPMMATASSFATALALIVVQWVAIALIITPSLAYMAEVTAFAGGDAYGIGYGIYNTAWGVGLLAGPALGGWLFDRIGFAALASSWAIVIIVGTIAIAAVKSHS